MMCCSTEPKNRTFVKGYSFFSFAKNVDKHIGKIIIKNLTGKYSQNLLDHAKKSQQMQ